MEQPIASPVVEEIQSEQELQPLAETFLDRQNDLERCLHMSPIEKDSASEWSNPELRSFQLRLRESLLRLKIWLADCDASEIPNALSINPTTEPGLYKTINNLAQSLRVHTSSVLEQYPKAVESAQHKDLTSMVMVNETLLKAMKEIEDVLQTLSTFLHPLQMAQALNSQTGPYANIRLNIENLQTKEYSQFESPLNDHVSMGSSESESDKCPMCDILVPWHAMEFHKGFCAGHRILNPISQDQISPGDGEVRNSASRNNHKHLRVRSHSSSRIKDRDSAYGGSNRDSAYGGSNRDSANTEPDVDTATQRVDTTALLQHTLETSNARILTLDKLNSSLGQDLNDSNNQKLNDFERN